MTLSLVYINQEEATVSFILVPEVRLKAVERLRWFPFLRSRGNAWNMNNNGNFNNNNNLNNTRRSLSAANLKNCKSSVFCLWLRWRI